MEWLLVPLALMLAAIIIVGPIVALVLCFVLLRRVAELQQRFAALDSAPRPPGSAGAAAEAVGPSGLSEQIVTAEAIGDQGPANPFASTPIPAQRAAAVPPIDWEQLIGRKALGWAAVLLLLLAAAFFLRYAYENSWVGPLGRVGVGILGGLALVLAGWHYHRKQWRIFSQMVSSAGVVVLYLSIYSSFGFYRLVPQSIAAVFLLVVILESALAALLYRSAALAWMSLLGGLLTPVLMSSDVDRYQSLFTYLLILNAGVIVLGRLRSWAGLGTAALVGTHVLFWIWYAQSYHPEKFVWAIGFQLAVYAIFVLLDLTRPIASRQPAGWEDLVRLPLNAFLWFAAAYVLLRPDYRPWLGLLAVTMAGVYVVVARLTLMRRAMLPAAEPADALDVGEPAAWTAGGRDAGGGIRDGFDERQLVTSLAAAVGFIALAIPIQADVEWVAFGWAAEAAALWWFGLRIRGPVLRAMAGALMALAASRLVWFDILDSPWPPDWPLVNRYALPALGVVACVLLSCTFGGRYRHVLRKAEKVLVAMATVGGLLLLWLVLSVDLLGFFDARAWEYQDEAVRWRWMGQLVLSAVWALYAVGLLGIGFARRAALLRWTALLIFAITTAKVVFYDMSGLREFYRILAFFIVAVVLGLAGWAYQRAAGAKERS